MLRTIFIEGKNQDLEIRWRNEKNLLVEIRAFKKELDEARVEAEHAELQTDLGKVAEIRYGKIPALEKKLKAKMDKLRNNQKKRKVLREEVTEEDIEQYASKDYISVFGWQYVVSISSVDKENGSPKLGDMIARNPKDHNDQWLVAEQYFKDNFEQLS